MNRNKFYKILSANIFVLVTLILFAPKTQAHENFAGITQPKWTYNLFNKSSTCYDPNRHCHFGSPVLEDINQDGKLDVVVATSGGHVLVVQDTGGSTGNLLWSRDTAAALGRPANSMKIISSPAVADVDNDGKPEIVVSTGHSQSNCNSPAYGSVIIYEDNGALKPGWPQRGQHDPVNGCLDGFGSTPALGNLDSDPQLEIVIGGFDTRIYAWNHNGTLLPNFPPDSYHAQRFDWGNLRNQIADTIWSSASIADLNADGTNEILIGTDEGMFGPGWQGNMGEWAGWNCGYVLPPGWPTPPQQPGTYCGGSLYGLNADGSLLDNFPRYYKEAVASSPVVADVDLDGDMEIFIGQGTFYHNNSPSKPTAGFRLYGLDSEGNELPGWEGGKALDGSARAIPALGDLTGDGKLEIVIPTFGSSVYAFHADGTLVNGFPLEPPKHRPNLAKTEFARSVVLGDYDGDGKDEIFLNHAWEVSVIDGNSTVNGKARILTGTNFPNHNRPIFLTNGSLINSPAVGDIDNDGQLELVVQNSEIMVFNLPESSSDATWPMEQLNGARTGYIEPSASLNTNTENLVIFHDENNMGNIQGEFTVSNGGTSNLDWSLSGNGGNFSFTPNAGTILGVDSVNVQFTIPRSTLSLGQNNRTITVVGTRDGIPVPGSPTNINVSVFVGTFDFVHLPLLKR